MASEYSKYVSNREKIEALPDLGGGDSHDNFGEVQNYLRRYGYLKPIGFCGRSADGVQNGINLVHRIVRIAFKDHLCEQNAAVL